MQLDMYLGPKGAFRREKNGEINWVDAMPGIDFGEFYKLCEDTCKTKGEGSVTIDYESKRYRASLIKAKQAHYYAIRLIGGRVKTLSELKTSDSVNRLLMNPSLRGLLLIVGEPFSGKTTLGCAAIRSRLDKFGGVAVTVEDPVEQALEEIHSRGKCFQTEARDFGGYPEALKASLRWTPDLVYLGELRDQVTAELAVRESINGQLIVATMHADSNIAAMARLKSWLLYAGGHEVDQILAEGLAGVIHLSMTFSPSQGGMVVSTKTLALPDDRADPMRLSIRRGSYELLRNEVVADF